MWQHKQGYGMSVEISCQTEYSATILDPAAGKAAEAGSPDAMSSIESPYLKLRTHWAMQAPDALWSSEELI